MGQNDHELGHSQGEEQCAIDRPTAWLKPGAALLKVIVDAPTFKESRISWNWSCDQRRS